MINTYLMHRLMSFDRCAHDFDSNQLEWLKEVVHNEYGNVSCVLLFGSMINGQPDNESDYDIYVICDAIDKRVHELRTLSECRLDVHLMTPGNLISRFKHEQKSRFCFFVKTVSESIPVQGKDQAMHIIDAARSIYTCAYEFDGWHLLKVSLDSQLRRFWRHRSSLNNNLYFTDLALCLLRVFSMSQFGWVSRVDVMLEWMREDSRSDLCELSRAYSLAIRDRPKDLFSLCKKVSSSLSQIGTDLRNFSIDSRGNIDYIT